MRIFLWTLGVALLVIASIVALDTPVPPPSMASVETALNHADFSGLPKKSSFAARDGVRLLYRAYPGTTDNIAVLVHGSSGTSGSMHVLAKSLQQRGLTVYALAMRGHDGSGTSGDIAYIGQLEDDVADFMVTVVRARPGAHRTLLGFSSGGGFVLRFMGTPDAKLFDRFVLIAPTLPRNAPPVRPYTGVGWVDASVPRIVILSVLHSLGLRALDHLPVLAFAVPPKLRNVQTVYYSFRLWRDFGPTDHVLDDLKRAPGTVSLFDGMKDEFFYPERYAAFLRPARPDLAITILPNLGHMDMVLKPAALDAIGDRVAAP